MLSMKPQLQQSSWPIQGAGEMCSGLKARPAAFADSYAANILHLSLNESSEPALR